MTRAANYVPLEYVENGSTTAHAIAPWVFDKASEIAVWRRHPTTLVETLLVQGSDYTVAGGAGSTGQVNKVNGGTSGHIIVIRRATSRDQQADYSNGDAFPAEVHEGALDHLAQVDQEQERAIGDLVAMTARALLVPEGETGASIPNVAGRKGLYLKFDALTGAPIVGNPSSEGATPTITFVVNTLAPGSAATLDVSGSWPNLTWTLGIPRGNPGTSGALGDATYGDIQVSGSGSVLSVIAGAITLTKMAQLPAGRFIGNNTGGNATPIALTATQATAMLALASTSAQGLGPARPSSSATIYFLRGDGNYAAAPMVIPLACSDENSALTAGTNKIRFRTACAMVLDEVRASLGTAQASGSIFTVDINEEGVSILSTKLTIDNTEKSSKTAATPCVISDANLADDAEITIDIDQVGDGTAKGLKVYLIGRKVS